MNSNKRAFTLIEILVVVLIIAILAAVALPQYQKAVEKTRVVEAKTLLKSIFQSAERYYLEKGTCPTQFEDLDIQIPWTGNTLWNTSIEEVRATRSGAEWSIQLLCSATVYGVEIGRIAGPYAGTGFGMYLYHLYGFVPKQKILCLEKNNHGNFLWEDKGAYCEKIFSGSKVYGSGAAYTYVYTIP